MVVAVWTVDGTVGTLPARALIVVEVVVVVGLPDDPQPTMTSTDSRIAIRRIYSPSSPLMAERVRHMTFALVPSRTGERWMKIGKTHA